MLKTASEVHCKIAYLVYDIFFSNRFRARSCFEPEIISSPYKCLSNTKFIVFVYLISVAFVMYTERKNRTKILKDFDLCLRGLL